jgi:acetyl esterase/lipase
LEIGILDISRDEVLSFASRIVAANIEVEVDFYSGQPHGYDKLAPVSAAAAQRAITDRVHATSAL